MVFFELIHLTKKAIIIVIVSIKHYINLFIHIFQTTKQNLVHGYYPSFRISSGTARSSAYYLDALDNQARATAMMYATG